MFDKLYSKLPTTFLQPKYLVLWTFVKCLMSKILIGMQAHPYFNPVRNAESSRTRTHWDVGACWDMVFVLGKGGLQQMSELLFLVELAFRSFGPCSVVKLSLIGSLPNRLNSGFQIIFWVENSVLKNYLIVCQMWKCLDSVSEKLNAFFYTI